MKEHKTTTQRPVTPLVKDESQGAKRPHKNLTTTQEEVAELASRMILHGGETNDVQLLLTALARYQYRNLTFIRNNCSANAEGKIRESAMVCTARWHSDLRQSWAKPTGTAAVAPSKLETRTVAEMVQADIRTSARRQFEEFITDMPGIEPIWLLNEILEDANAGEDLTKAIFYSLDSADIYVKVASQHEERVREFIALLDHQEAA